MSPHLVDVELNFKELIYEQGDTIDSLYFVEDGVVSLVVVLLESEPIECGTVGYEGVTGVPAILGNDVAPGRAICQVPGAAKRLPLAVFRELPATSMLSTLVMRYTNALISMISQTAACNRAHPLEERMCRWLLMTHDRVGRNEFPLTQEFLAQMLGVRRPSVSLAGVTLQNAGLIRYTRGRMTVLDRQGLEASSCECYERIRNEFENVFAKPETAKRKSRRKPKEA